MKRFKILNLSLGWLCFVVAAVTYILTLEPTASFWDCPEFIAQGTKLEVGHPPGNPIFMLAARFFVNFAGGDASLAAYCVNTMSALLSAGTILFLFWSITHLARRLVVADDATEISLPKTIAILGSGLCGALVYTWSDTFWFSAVEGEVYAFSSFCTALVFWLILRWEDRADAPHSDKYLIFIAYIIGISIAVHLLNLLCIPAIALVIYYRKTKESTAKDSLITLGASCVVIGLILYGLVPGFIEMAQYFELFCVNTLSMSYNVGVLIYAVLLIAALIWSIYELYVQRSGKLIRISALVAVFLSGVTFIGDSILIPVVLTIALGAWLFFSKKVSYRLLSIAVTSILVIFIGYSSYALILVRSAANPTMNQNAPDNVFSLASYLNREQYGENPLFYGRQFTSTPVYVVDDQGNANVQITKGKNLYAKAVKSSPEDKDKYIVTGQKETYTWTPNVLFPRMYSRSGSHPQGYLDWIGATQADMETVTIYPYVNEDGSPVEMYGQKYSVEIKKPTAVQNLEYFINYQFNHMYMRYFMWNFAGRQNDLQGNGEVNRGNWISGIPFIDNARLGDQSLLPDEFGKGNKGHNVFYMLPLLLGLIGMLWQAFYSKRGIEQFWVVFFFFFMTGIAIVLYLNQPPMQPRERDYAFAGSFYAFAIWVGMGVLAIATMLKKALKKNPKAELPAAIAATVIGILVPLQMVSQTWDDHDRSGRYTARDYGFNYLSSLAPNSIIFTNGDNDTFPLWYAQEVEGYRNDVRVVNLSYLTTDWYANQMKISTEEAAGIDMLAKSSDYAYDRLQFNYINDNDVDSTPVNALSALDDLYRNAPKAGSDGISYWKHPNMYIPVDVNQAVKAGIISAEDALTAKDTIVVNFLQDQDVMNDRGASLSKALSLDMLATSVKNGWNRPIYFAMTVPESYYIGLTPYMRNTGLAYQVTPMLNQEVSDPLPDADRMYKNVMEKFRWGGLDTALESGKSLYLDETIRRMVTTHRSSLLDLARTLYNNGIEYSYNQDGTKTTDAERLAKGKEYFTKCGNILEVMDKKLSVKFALYGIQIGEQIGDLYCKLGNETGNKDLIAKGHQTLENEIRRYAQTYKYLLSLQRVPWQLRTISRVDRYAPTYLTSLIETYYSDGGDVETLVAELEKTGVDITTLLTAQANSAKE